MYIAIQIYWGFINPINPKSDQILISPYNNIAESFIMITRILEMIPNLRGFETNSPCQYEKKCIVSWILIYREYEYYC